MIQNFAKVFALFVLAACSSTQKTTEFAQDRVVGRMDDLEKRPSWASESQTVRERDDNYLIVGIGEVPGDSRVQAAFKVSDANARGHLANKLELQITKIVEASESGFSMEDQKLQSLIRELSQNTFRNIDIKERYWEKVVKTASTGEETLTLKTFSLLSISKADFKKLLLKTETKKSVANSKDIRGSVENILRKQWSEEGFVDASADSSSQAASE